MKKISFMDTSFRDGFQSYFGARVLTKDFLPAVEAAAIAGVDHFEIGGGARFQSPMLYCNESPFNMMDQFAKAAGKNAKLQTLARGINVVALSAQPKDMIELHAKVFKAHGVTHIRNFDSLNDVQNLQYSAECIAKYGLHHQVAITLMELPPGCSGAHDVPFYVNTLRKILDSGLPFNSICFKDASGTANPQKVYHTVKEVRKLVGNDISLWFHSHSTSGIGEVQYLSAINAGIDGVCVARKPVSGGTAQPDLLSMNHILKGTEFTFNIDEKKILEANAIFSECLKDYFFPPEALAISPEVIFSPMPGGALTANTMMMRDTGTLHLYPKVIEEMGNVVKKGGFGTSVTPTSQFYFQQAYANVTQGPWVKIVEGYGDTVLGYFGRTPVAPDPEIVEIASKQMGKPPYKGNPLDLLAPGIPEASELLRKHNLPVTDENIFIIGAMKTSGSNKGLDFLQGNAKISVRKISDEKKEAMATTNNNDAGPKSYKISVDGKSYDVVVQEGNQEILSVKQTDAIAGLEVKSKLPGNVLSVLVKKGDVVTKGQKLLVLEAMKMETPINAPKDGKVLAVNVSKGSVIKTNQTVVVME